MSHSTRVISETFSKPISLLGMEKQNLTQQKHIFTNQKKSITTQRRRPASADRTARRQFQAVFPVITGSFPTNVTEHLHGFMDLTVGRTVGPTVDSTVG